jgi:hypothetical protein
VSFALLIIGLTLVTVAVRNTQDVFVKLVKGDFTGQGNFFWWVAALLIIGGIGYIEKLRPLSDGLLVMILVALILSRGRPTNPSGGFFNQFLLALKGTQTTAASVGLNFDLLSQGTSTPTTISIGV